ncbi:triphosphoribosyl-dephospho-CoA synthase [Micromonospora sp. NPDC047707]|uniref:triphosphoribosyl-dephospho-CoA synthase n=1 Tax=Micromonospora sp. NPDC047707 TaxID=3154498 RepID=UPI00345130AE
MTAVLSAPTVALDGRIRSLSDDELAGVAVKALLDEAVLTPKPGLVDLRGRGAHRDMDAAMIIVSALNLRDTFRRLAKAGRSALAGAKLRAELGRIGRDGEKAMFRVTGGVNTHRGAIWALGLTVAAAARQGPSTPRELLREVATIAAYDDPAAFAEPTKGRIVRARYHVTGAVGEARAGFPHALAALDTLTRTRDRGSSETDARLGALLTSIAGLEDTCLLGRGGPPALAFARDGAAAVLRAGGAASPAGRLALAQFDHDLVHHGLSPGGSADMLALALLLDRVTSQARSTGTDD